MYLHIFGKFIVFKKRDYTTQFPPGFPIFLRDINNDKCSEACALTASWNLRVA